MTDHQIYYDVGCRSIYEMIAKFAPRAIPVPPNRLPPLNTAAYASHLPPTSQYRCLCLPTTAYLFLPLPVPTHRLPPLPTAACASPPPPNLSRCCIGQIIPEFV